MDETGTGKRELNKIRDVKWAEVDVCKSSACTEEMVFILGQRRTKVGEIEGVEREKRVVNAVTVNNQNLHTHIQTSADIH